jgi:3-oxoacyl-[acyl-carrier protein] reductase
MTQQRKVALVTGSSRGIGRAIALDMAQQGADVIVNYRSKKDQAQNVVEEIWEKGGNAMVIKADISKEVQVADMVDQSLEQFGRIDILVNNAAVHRGGRVQLLSTKDWDLVINTALKGTFNCCRYIVPSMIDQGCGRIINLSSPSGDHGYPGDTAYGSAKAGLIGFTKCLAKEVAGKGITANVVIPGLIITEMTAALFDTHDKMAREFKSIPMGRPGELHEIAEVVSFLSFKGSYITGAVIRVDGGMGM